MLPILDSLHLLGGELQSHWSLKNQHYRGTKTKLADLGIDGFFNMLVFKHSLLEPWRITKHKMVTKKNSPVHRGRVLEGAQAS